MCVRISTALVFVALGTLAGCSAFRGADNDAYLKSKALPPLQAPPTIALPERDPNYRIPQAATPAAKPSTAAVAAPVVRPAEAVPAAKAEPVSIQTEGALRWLSVPQPPERIWAPLKAFWADQGVKLAEDRPEVGVMRTEWINENPKLTAAELQRLVAEGGDAKEAVLRHQYRVRVERTAQGSNVFLTYQGARLVKGEDGKPRWQMEAAKPELETVMLNRLQQRLSRL